VADYGVNINLRVKGQSGLDRLKAKVNELTASIDKIRGVDIMNPRNVGGAGGKDARKTIKQYRQDMENLVKTVNKSEGVFGKTRNQQLAAIDALQEYSNSLTIGSKRQKAAVAATLRLTRQTDLDTVSILENTKARKQNIALSRMIGKRIGGGGGGRNPFPMGNPRGNQAALTSGLISGAFPLLFGQGPLGAAAGFAGGFAGTKIGGQMGGFAGGLVATGVLQQLTTAKEKIEELGKALSFFSFDVSAVSNALGLVGTPAAEYLELIEKTEGKQAAFNESMRRMEELVGEDGVKALQDFAESTRELQSSITKFITQVAAKAAELFTGGSERVTGLRRRQLLGEARDSTDTNIQALLTERAGLTGASGRRRREEIDQEIIALMLTKETNKENLDLEKLRAKQYDEITKSVENKNLFLNESLTLGTREAEIQEKLREFDRKALQFDKEINKQERDQFENALRLQQELERVNSLYQGIASTVQSGLVDAIEGAINGTKTLGDVARSVFGAIQRQLINFAATSFLRAIPGIGGFFANGGVTKPNKSYIVGERGPELFTPGVTGRVTPNHEMGGGSTNVVVNVDASGSNVEGDEDEGRALGVALSAAIEAELLKQKRPGGLLA
jgi:hypothetical protein